MTGVPRPSGALQEEGRRGGNVRDIYYGQRTQPGEDVHAPNSVIPRSRGIRDHRMDLLGALFQATETGSGQIRTFSWQCLAVSSDAAALSLIAASQRDTGVWVRRATPAGSCRELEPHHLVVS